ncbi:CobW HypB UreG nucleotide binding domain [Trypanosoma vivax]|nr:CobW HypB UreG nucleotide binding domain [Trypanosoma vivax]
MSDDECPELVSARVPVTILTGFLGSGKTTLLHYVLSAEHSLRIAVIVNEFEFGKSIEKGLTLKSSQKPDDEWLELNNGWMCCTTQTQTVKALEGLMQSKGTFDLVLVETSGLADPAPVAGMFWQDESLCGSLYLSGITVVDAKNLCNYLSDPDVSAEETRRVLMADRVVLNKCDIATEERQGAALDAVKRINPVVQVVRSPLSRLENLRDILMLNTTRQAF